MSKKPVGIGNDTSQLSNSRFNNGQHSDISHFRVADVELDSISHNVWRGSNKIDLTAKEYSLLYFMIRNTGKVLTRGMIAEHFQMDASDRTNTIDVYVAYLRNKLDRDYPLKLIHTVRGQGYVFGTQNSPENIDVGSSENDYNNTTSPLIDTLRESAIHFSDLKIDRILHKAWRSGNEINLTEKEYVLLEHFVLNAGIELTRDGIANDLQHAGFESKTNIIDVYVNYLRKKVDHGFSRPLIRTIRGKGYVLREE